MVFIMTIAKAWQSDVYCFDGPQSEYPCNSPCVPLHGNRLLLTTRIWCSFVMSIKFCVAMHANSKIQTGQTFFG